MTKSIMQAVFVHLPEELELQVKGIPIKDFVFFFNKKFLYKLQIVLHTGSLNTIGKSSNLGKSIYKYSFFDFEDSS